MAFPIQVSSEIGHLDAVLVHRPDDGIGRITPRRAEELLFDDIVHLPLMKQEHDVFTAIMKRVLPDLRMFDVQDLLAEGLSVNPELKTTLIRKVVAFEELPESIGGQLEKMDATELSKTLITGFLPQGKRYLFDPIPNFIFTRDIAVVINDHILITKAAKSARFRENLLTRFIIYAHPIFKSNRDNDMIINLNDAELFGPSALGEAVSVEGGDVMTFNQDTLLIGCSERTSQHAINVLKEALFERNVVQNVVQMNIPAQRYCMHIDTLFTHIDENEIVGFKPIVMEGISSNVIMHTASGSQLTFASIKDFFHHLHSDIRFLPAGNGQSPYQEREQWTDGCNLVALKPGVALTYDRNMRTDDMFRENGYDVKSATELLKGDADLSQLEKTIITLPSTELSRARGGSHCMTCPILRRPV